MPHSSAFLDHAPAAFMPSVFIHDIVPEGLRVRFMGTALAERWQHDLTGRIFGAELGEAARGVLVSRATTVASHPCGLHQLGQLQTSSSRMMEFEAVLLPLAVDAGRPLRIVAYSQVLQTFDRDEHTRRFAAGGKHEWIDLGAGAPADPPA